MTERSNDVLSFRQRMLLELLWLTCRGVAAMPYAVQYYVIQEAVEAVLRCVRYRRRRITSNLRKSFPDMPEKEIARLRRRVYSNLAEAVVNTAVLARMTPDECRRRLEMTGTDMIESITGGGPCVVLASHSGAWEYYSFSGMLFDRHTIALVYHRLHSPVFEALYKRLRNHDNGVVIASSDAVRFFARHRDGLDGRALILGLISDQNPPRTKECHWYRFLNRDTLFFEGGERIALKYGIPVFYTSQCRQRRGYYKASFELLWDGRSDIAPHEITERYVRLLERDIKACPERWLWSHHRWKHCRDNG